MNNKANIRSCGRRRDIKGRFAPTSPVKSRAGFSDPENEDQSGETPNHDDSLDQPPTQEQIEAEEIVDEIDNELAEETSETKWPFWLKAALVVAALFILKKMFD